MCTACLLRAVSKMLIAPFLERGGLMGGWLCATMGRERGLALGGSVTSRS